MADTAGLILGLPGALTASVQCFEMIQFGRHFQRDFGECRVMLKASQIHLARWGVALGIAEEPLRQDVVARLKTYPPDEVETARDLLAQIQRTFQDAQQDCARFKRSELKNGKGSTLELLDNEGELTETERRFKTLHVMQRKAIEKYNSAVDATRGAADRTTWALYQRTQLTDLVGRISALVSELEALFPAGVQEQVKQKEQHLSRDEVRDLDEQSLATLRKLAGDRDQCLKWALEQEAQTRGMSFEDFVIDGNARTRLGHEFTGDSSGRIHVDGGANHSYKGMRIGGDSISQLGNSYGGPSVLAQIAVHRGSPAEREQE